MNCGGAANNVTSRASVMHALAQSNHCVSADSATRDSSATRWNCGLGSQMSPLRSSEVVSFLLGYVLLAA